MLGIKNLHTIANSKKKEIPNCDQQIKVHGDFQVASTWMMRRNQKFFLLFSSFLVHFYFKVDFFHRKTANSRFCLRLRAENDRKSFQISVDPWEYFTWKSSRQSTQRKERESRATKLGCLFKKFFKHFFSHSSRKMIDVWNSSC